MFKKLDWIGSMFAECTSWRRMRLCIRLEFPACTPRVHEKLKLGSCNSWLNLAFHRLDIIASPIKACRGGRPVNHLSMRLRNLENKVCLLGSLSLQRIAYMRFCIPWYRICSGVEYLLMRSVPSRPEVSSNSVRAFRMWMQKQQSLCHAICSCWKSYFLLNPIMPVPNFD